jgi:hypothetical protein
MPRLLLVSVTLAFAALPAAAQVDEYRRWITDDFEPQPLSVRYGTLAYFDAGVDGQNTDMHLVKHELGVRIPLLQEERRAWALTLGVGAVDIDSNARLFDTDFPWPVDHFPSELWNIEIGTTYRQKLENDWTVGGEVRVGSPSDRPFGSLDEVAVNATGYLRIPDGERNAWLLFVNYNNNREFLENVPIPGVGYHYVAGREFNALVGIPISTVFWQPAEDWTLTGRYFVPRQIDLELAYQVIDPLALYIGYQWDNDRWFRADRRDDDDRLFYYEQRGLVGLRWDVTEAARVELAGGYAFERFWFEGEGYEDRHDSRVSLDSGPFLKLELAIRL